MPPRLSVPDRSPDDHDIEPSAVEFSIMVGRLPYLERAISDWDTLIAGPPLRILVPPVIYAFPANVDFDPAQAVRVAVIRHAPTVGRQLVPRVQTALQRLGLAEHVLIEEGYFFVPAGNGGAEIPRFGSGSWKIHWNLAQPGMRPSGQRLGLPTTAIGVRWMTAWTSRRQMIIVDTGDRGTRAQLAFSDTAVPREEPSRDFHGHGTTVGALVRMLAPAIETCCYRVVDADKVRAESGVVINALSVATNSTQVNVVCVPLRVEVDVRDIGSRGSLEYVLKQRVSEGTRTPVIVTAAGNVPSEYMSFPATIPDVIVAAATNREGKPASYNCMPPRRARINMVGGFGGVRGDPVGTVKGTNSGDWELYGSSYAAAHVAAAICMYR